MYTLLHGAPSDPSVRFRKQQKPNADRQQPLPPPAILSSSSTPVCPPPAPVKSLRPPDQPKPSYLHQNASFSAFRSANPQLLSDINRQLQTGLHDLKRKGVDGSVEATLDVYRGAFQNFIEEFNIYRPFLESVKTQYEKTLDTLGDRLRSAVTFHVDFAAKDEEHAVELREMARQQVMQVNELREANKTLGTLMADRDRRLKDAEAERDELRAGNTKLQGELNEAKNAIGILTRGLSNLEEEKRKQDLREQDHASELSFLNSQLQKTASDLEK